MATKINLDIGGIAEAAVTKWYSDPVIRKAGIVGGIISMIFYVILILNVIAQTATLTRDLHGAGATGQAMLNVFLSSAPNLVTTLAISIVLIILLGVIVAYAGSIVVGRVAMGFKPKFNELSKKVITLLPRVVLTYIIYEIILCIPLAIATIIMLAGAAYSSLALVFFGAFLLLCALILVLYAGLRMSLYIPTIIVENLGPIQALKRSWALTRGNWWGVFVISFLVSIVISIISYPVNLIMQIFISSSIKSAAGFSITPALVVIIFIYGFILMFLAVCFSYTSIGMMYTQLSGKAMPAKKR